MGRPHSARADGARLREILAILNRHGVARGLTPEKLRQILEDLGPTFVKIGQIMSMRSDMIPREYCAELEKLRSAVAPMPMEEVRRAVEASLGAPLGALFRSFEETPLGSASIAQAHRAVLPDGSAVVVKVQRPGIRDTMAQDIALMRRASGLLKLASGTGDAIDFGMVLDELWAVSQQEMNFLAEADNAEEFYRLSEPVAYSTCPRIYRKLTTTHVLVMEYVDGLPIDELGALEREGYDAREIAAKLAENYIKQIVDDGFFHADPHPGNLRVRGGEIVWIDLGMMGRLTARDQGLIGEAVAAVARHDVDAISRVLLTLGRARGKVNHARLYGDIDGMLSRYAEADLASMDMAEMMNELIALSKDHGISLPPGMSMLARGLATLEGVLAQLDPQFNIMTATAAHVSGDALSRLDWKKELERAARAVYSSCRKSLDIPAQLSDLLGATNRGLTKINLDLGASEDFGKAALALINRLILCGIAMALLIGFGILCTTDLQPRIAGIPLIGALGFAAGLALAAWLVISARKHK